MVPESLSAQGWPWCCPSRRALKAENTTLAAQLETHTPSRMIRLTIKLPAFSHVLDFNHQRAASVGDPRPSGKASQS